MKLGKILIVDDEPQIVKILEHALGRDGFTTEVAFDGEEAVRKAEAARPDLVILDIMLPGIDGFEVCRRIKARNDIPVIFLTAKEEEVDKIVGFRMGADDYQTKPFSPSELVMRVKAVLRRSGEKDKEAGEILSFDGLEINKTTRGVTVRGQKTDLTAKEFDLLWLMASQPGRVFTRMNLLEQVWDSSYPGDENTVTVHVRRLREKIESDPANPGFVVTVWGVGYKFEAAAAGA